MKQIAIIMYCALFLIAIEAGAQQKTTSTQTTVDKSSVKTTTQPYLGNAKPDDYQKPTVGVNNQPIRVRPAVNNTTPDGFPQFINTGNPEQDAENYRIAKERWIQENPEKYQQMLNPQK